MGFVAAGVFTSRYTAPVHIRVLPSKLRMSEYLSHIFSIDYFSSWCRCSVYTHSPSSVYRWLTIVDRSFWGSDLVYKHNFSSTKLFQSWFTNTDDLFEEFITEMIICWSWTVTIMLPYIRLSTMVWKCMI